MLNEAMPQSNAIKHEVINVKLQISTSSLYSNIISNRKILHFISKPQFKKVSYDLLENGENGDIHDHAIFETTKHAEPTPFTQWTIKLVHPERVNLDGLKGVFLSWQGHVRFDEGRRRRKH